MLCYVVLCCAVLCCVVVSQGSCANAPMVQMNDDYYECLTPESTRALLDACKKGQPPKMGKWGSLPMNGQVGILHHPSSSFIITSSQHRDTNMHQEIQTCILTITNHTNFISLSSPQIYLLSSPTSRLSHPPSSPSPIRPPPPTTPA